MCRKVAQVAQSEVSVKECDNGKAGSVDEKQSRRRFRGRVGEPHVVVQVGDVHPGVGPLQQVGRRQNDSVVKCTAVKSHLIKLKLYKPKSN